MKSSLSFLMLFLLVITTYNTSPSYSSYSGDAGVDSLSQATGRGEVSDGMDENFVGKYENKLLTKEVVSYKGNYRILFTSAQEEKRDSFLAGC